MGVIIALARLRNIPPDSAIHSQGGQIQDQFCLCGQMSALPYRPYFMYSLDCSRKPFPAPLLIDCLKREKLLKSTSDRSQPKRSNSLAVFLCLLAPPCRL